MNVLRILTAALVVGFTPAVLASDPPQISEIVVFGPSFSDTGNAHILTGGFIAPPPAYFGGRWCNGLMWHEHVAGGLGIPAAAPSLAGGTNFAIAGAETGDGYSAFGTPNVGLQIDTYLAGGGSVADQLFIVQGGGNDLSLTRPGGPRVPQDVVDNMAAHIEELAGAGAAYFVVPNLHPLGASPAIAGLGPDAVDQQNDLVREFNRRLRQRLRGLERELDVVIVTPNFYAAFEVLLAFPQLIGVEDTTGTAKLNPADFFDGAVVDDPDSFFWLDILHPTAPVQEALGTLTLIHLGLQLGDCDGRTPAGDPRPAPVSP